MGCKVQMPSTIEKPDVLPAFYWAKCILKQQAMPVYTARFMVSEVMLVQMWDFANWGEAGR